MVTVKAGNRGGVAGEESLSAGRTARVTGLQNIGGPVRLQGCPAFHASASRWSAKPKAMVPTERQRRDHDDTEVTDAALERDTRCHDAVRNDRSASAGTGSHNVQTRSAP